MKENSTPDRPEIGEAVHYLDGVLDEQHLTCRRAVVCAVPEQLLAGDHFGSLNGTDGEWAADLEVTDPTTTFLNVLCAEDSPRRGTWHRAEAPSEEASNV
ncbi:hypothetical protein EES43_24620 [Streptomyces sp. ADI96-02]|uniref:hypothetical protein n=1 Tax=Streptomyces sp. ADI96-02 TaxID=1522760 RepID=UPI000F54FAF4|nr:hypothetical protein [Streptomyces sp. ADI96-02]RPK56230.1 hypothetical protein EES43_24620 [Streptomyces sp. ADI96-02]